MKDAYSFHLDEPAARPTAEMYDAYCRIFERMGLTSARCGRHRRIGGSEVARIPRAGRLRRGRDRVPTRRLRRQRREGRTALAPAERVRRRASHGDGRHPGHAHDRRRQRVPGRRRRNALVKTLMVRAATDAVVALVLRGDHELNAIKRRRSGRRHAAAHGHGARSWPPHRLPSRVRSDRSASACRHRRSQRRGARRFRLRRQPGRATTSPA
jgi:hypothetical protein